MGLYGTILVMKEEEKDICIHLSHSDVLLLTLRDFMTSPEEIILLVHAWMEIDLHHFSEDEMQAYDSLSWIMVFCCRK
jgi:hypothetical protein